MTTHPLITGIVDIHDDDGRYDLDAARAGGVVAIIHKLTEGGDFHDRDDLAAVAKLAASPGLLLGLYHFANGRPGVIQADHFIEHAALYPDALLVLDMESNEGSSFGTMTTVEAVAFVRRVYERLGDDFGWEAVLGVVWEHEV